MHVCSEEAKFRGGSALGVAFPCGLCCIVGVSVSYSVYRVLLVYVSINVGASACVSVNTSVLVDYSRFM
jgi:hypothetical protein